MVVGKTEVTGSEAFGSTVLSGHLCEHITEHKVASNQKNMFKTKTNDLFKDVWGGWTKTQ